MILDSIALWDETKLFFEQGSREIGFMGYLKCIFTEDTVKVSSDCLSPITPDDKYDLENLFRFLETEDGGFLLRSLSDMISYCEKHSRNHIPYPFDRECFGFRVMDEGIVWYISCTPWNERCHFAVYGYMRDSLFSAMSKVKGLPTMCYGVLGFTGERIKIYYGVREVERFPQYGGDGNANSRYADEENSKMKVTKAQRSAMENGALFGWDTPMSEVSDYNKDGQYCPGEEKKKK